MCDNNMAVLGALGVTKTRFVSVMLMPNNTQGIALGQGACKAVLLKANYWKTNGADPQVDPSVGTAYFYYGDSRQQTYEYLILNPFSFPNDATQNYIGANLLSSEMIICNDLNDIWLRIPTGFADSIEIQAIIYS